MIGKTVSHYRITEKLGEGGMGQVYLANDLKLERKVAIKFLPQHLTRDKGTIERFQREAKAAASLNHTNIVTIHDVIEENNQTCIVMEYVEGKTLRDVINEKPQFPIPNSVDIISQIADGLSKAHKAGIIHRDIKPENIIIDHDDRVKILDFGLAKLKGVSKLTRDDSTLGTIHYMSPEQARGDEVDHRSDIWSLGVVFYELLTGDVPFKGDYDQAVVYSIQNEEFEPVENIPQELNKALPKFLAKEPDERYQSLEEFKSESSDEREEKEGVAQTQKYIIYPIIIITLVVIGFFLKPYFSFDTSKDSSSGWENSIAILPFVDLSPEGDQEWFCDGMTKQIISNIRNFPQLKAIAFQSVKKYKNTDKSISEIGEELEVAYVLEPSFRKFGNRIRMTVHLINTQDDFQVWSEDYDRDYQDLFNIQDEVSEVIVSNLFEQVSPKQLAEVKTKRPQSTEAYDYYLKGKYFRDEFYEEYIRTARNVNNLRLVLFHKSEDMFLKSIEIDSNYVLSLAGLADLYFGMATLIERDSVKQLKYVALGKKYIENAISIDKESAYVNRIMGTLYAIKHNSEKEYQFTKKAYILDPTNADTNFDLGLFYFWLGLNNHAIKFFSRAIEFNPLNTAYFCFKGWAHWKNGEYEKANIIFEKGLEIDHDNECLLRWYTMSLIDENKINEADSIVCIYRSVFSDTIKFSKIYYAFNYAIHGEREKALNIVIKKYYYKETLYHLLGMREEVFSELYRVQRNVKKRRRYNAYLQLKYQPKYNIFRSDPRFQEILATHKEIYEENLEKYGDIDI